MLKNIILTSLLISLSGHIIAQDVCYNPNLVRDTTKKSIKSKAVGVVGNDTVTISYHSPGVRKRIIWGGLVPFDEVWVTGAHNATTIEIGSPFVINDVKIPAGKYAFFTIPGEKEWIVIVNRHWNQHLASEYDPKDDVVRFALKPETIPHLERLQYFIEAGKDNKGTIAVAWEKLRISFPITVN